MLRGTSVTMSALLIAFSALLAAPYGELQSPQDESSLREVDYQAYIDANRIFQVVSNVGHLAWDITGAYGGGPGLYFPYTGYPDFPGENTVVYASGLWMAGRVNGQLREAIAEYSRDFVPGPMVGGTYLPDDPSFRVYKIDASSGPGDPDYDNWPIHQGAPSDGSGNPMLLGDQTLWCVYNDADPFQHEFGPYSLGIEVQQTVWASDVVGSQTIINVKYLIYNKGGNQIDDCYIGFWTDSDIGNASDDFVGCDSADNLFYFYNDGPDSDYGDAPPTWGGKLISGPVVPAPGEMAVFDGNPLPDYRNLPLNSFVYIYNGIDPSTSQEMYNNLMGVSRYGNPYIDPFTAQQTKFPYGGDPVTGTGWIDPASADKRSLIGMGPLSLAPGDSQQVVLKFAAAQGADPLTALSTLRQTLNVAAPDFPAPTYSSCDSANVTVNDYGTLDNVYFTGGDRWITGYDWSGDFLFGGIDVAEKLYGSNLVMSDLDDVELRFSRVLGQFAYRYLRSPLPEITYAGYYEVPFTAWDVTNNRQLNVLFTESAGSTVFDSTWGPANSLVEADGGGEIILITDSDYSGYEPASSPVDYQSADLSTDGDILDLQYAIWPAVRQNHDLSELDEGQRLRLLRQILNSNGAKDTLYFNTPDGLNFAIQDVSIDCFGDGDRLLDFDLLSGTNFSLFDRGAIFNGVDAIDTRVRFSAFSDGQYSDMLQISDPVSGQMVKEVQLFGGRSTFAPKAIMEPDTMRYFFQYAIDTFFADCYFGDFDDGHTTGQVVLSSVELSTPGGVIPTIEVLPLPGHGDFYGGVIGISFDARDFVASYGPVLGKGYQPYTVSGLFADGEPFELPSQVIFSGHMPGDVNFDGKISIADAVYIVNYIFGGGTAPDPLLAGDVDCGGTVSVGDAVYLINFIFTDGPSPCER